MKRLSVRLSGVLSVLSVATLFLGCVVQGSARDSQFPPWEVWNDLRRLPLLFPEHQVLLRSSHCPEGCRYDRHSAESWRYLRLEGSEGVIFEEYGAGAITRIWVTQGHGVSDPLNPEIRFRVYLDGASSPAIDLPLPALFDNSTPPFQAPLVGHRLDSSGGNFSYVPIPYRSGCKITLEGAHEETLWYQFNFHRLASASRVRSFTGDEDLANWTALLHCQGCDPWLLGNGLPESSQTHSGTIQLSPGSRQHVIGLTGPDILTALLVAAPPDSWQALSLELDFDGEQRAAMTLAQFFAAESGGADSTRSLLIGADLAQRLYSYFPMPFYSSCELSFSLDPDAPAPVNLDWGVRHWGAPPLPGSALFTAQLHQNQESAIGVDLPLLELGGSGRLAGLFAVLGSVNTQSRDFLEGDERIYLDGSSHPGIYGTGTEDLFNGGFYFDQGEFELALHGSPSHFKAGGENSIAMYRLMLNDGAVWVRGLRAGLEGGPESNVAVRATTVAYAYQNPNPRLWPWHRLDLGDPTSRAAHGYRVTSGSFELRHLNSSFEGEPPRALARDGLYRSSGAAEFSFELPAGATSARLRRRFDAGVAWQAATLSINGRLAARLAPNAPNQDRRWREMDVDLDPATLPPEGGPVTITVTAHPHPEAATVELGFSEFTWELWCDVDPLPFRDDFENGEATAWSSFKGGAHSK